MLFNSYTFIYLFLPVVWGGYWFVRRHNAEAALWGLVLASLFFYGYWDIRFLPLLLLSIFFNHIVGHRIFASSDHAVGRRWLVFGIAFNLALLAFFKYLGFLSEAVEELFGNPIVNFDILLPIGISFFTFQQITYLVDIRRGVVSPYLLQRYVLFVSFFPQLISGPIVHHSEMMPQFEGRGRIDWTGIAMGMSIFIAGLFKKLVLADNIAPYVGTVFRAADAGLDVTFLESWAALIGFSFQMYFDFSGYCDMALGLGLLFGIRLPINFDSPYKAKTVSEYWRRWNITLGRFLRDYVYLPLGGSQNNHVMTMINMMIVMFISGAWHGAGWGFLLWGILNGFWLWCNYISAQLHNHFGRKGRSVFPRAVAQIMTFAAVSFGWCFFKPTTFVGLSMMTSASLGLNGLTIPLEFQEPFRWAADVFSGLGFAFQGQAHVGLGDWAQYATPLIIISFFIVWGMPNTNEIFLSRDHEYSVAKKPRRLVWQPRRIWLTGMSIAFCLTMLFASTISEFLYFQF